jgi:hypothetical protein
LVNGSRAKRIFVAEGFYFLADALCQSFGILISPNVEVEVWSPLSGKLKVAKVNYGGGGIAQVENPGVLGNANDFEILKFGPKAVTNVLSDSVTARKKAFREAFADDCDVWMLCIVRKLNLAASQQMDAESVQKTRPNCCPDRHHMETGVRIF